jgi:hypothetical protein
MSQQAIELEFRYQCVLCGLKLKELPSKTIDGVPHCPRCGAPNIRDVELTSGEYDNVPLKTVEHLFKKVENCAKELRDPKNSNNFVSHKFVEKIVGVVDLGKQEYYDQLQCGGEVAPGIECGAVYAYYRGRQATAQELADCKAGKIPKKSKAYEGLTGGSVR